MIFGLELWQWLLIIGSALLVYWLLKRQSRR